MISDTRPEVSDDPEHVAAAEPRARHRRRTLLMVGVVLVAGVFVTRSVLPDEKVDVRDGTTLVDADGLAARYGIDVTLLGVSAAGGLIDFRYQVVDPDKASRLLHDSDLYPKFVVEDTGELLAVKSLPHSHGTELQLGGTYFFLLANAHNAIHPGSSVTVVIGDTRLEHVKAQG